MASVDALGQDLINGVRYYHFNIVFDTENWIITKSYADFVALKEALEEVYPLEQIPYLTGEVRPWARHSEQTALSRLPKLEIFLMELLATRFKPDIYDVCVPFMSKNVKDYRISKFAFDFLDFASHYKPHMSPKRNAGPPSSSSPQREEEQKAQATASAELEKVETEAERLEREREAEIKRLVLKQKSSAAAIAKSTEAAARTSITHEMKIHIVSFEIFDRDRIDYIISIELWDRTWYVSKRYSDFVDLYSELMSIYGGGGATERGAMMNHSSSGGGGGGKPIAARGSNTSHARSNNVFHNNPIKDSSHNSSQRHGGVVNSLFTSPFFGGDSSPSSPLPSSSSSPASSPSGGGRCVVRSIEASKAPFYKKLDPETGRMRQEFFQDYLQKLVEAIDEWEPKGLVATFNVQADAGTSVNEQPLSPTQQRGAHGAGNNPDNDFEVINSDGTVSNYNAATRGILSSGHTGVTSVDGGRRAIVNVSVSVNKVLFDFFNFQEHMSTINAYVARKIIAKQSEALPEEVRKAMVAKKEAERRLKVISELQQRQRTRTVLPESTITEFLDLLPLLQEDRDILNSIRYLTEFGTVCRDLRELDALYGCAGLGGGGGAATRSGGGGGAADGAAIASGDNNMMPSVNPFFRRGVIALPPPQTSLGRDAAASKVPLDDIASGGNVSQNNSFFERRNGGGGSSNNNSNPIFNSPTNPSDSPSLAPNTTATASTSSNPFGSLRVGTRRLAGLNGMANYGGGSGGGPSPSSAVASPTDNTANHNATSGLNSSQPPTPRSTPELNNGPNAAASQKSKSGATAARLPPPPKTRSALVGISSQQAARIAAAIFFNDTRRKGIWALGHAIVDDRYWDDLFNTLIYEWDECRHDVEEVLIRSLEDRERRQ